MSKVMTVGKVSQLEVMKSVRKDWGSMSPVTRVKSSKKVYNRKKMKQVW